MSKAVMQWSYKVSPTWNLGCGSGGHGRVEKENREGGGNKELTSYSKT